MSSIEQPRLLLTRPAAHSAEVIAALAARGIAVAAPIISPLMEIVYRADVPPAPQGVTGVVLTSANALGAPVLDSLPRGLPAFCVGDRTAAAAAARGFVAQSAGADANALVAMITDAEVTGPLLHPHGAHTRGDVAERLQAAGIPCASLVVYDQLARPLSAQALDALAGTAPLIVPLYSPRSAQLLAGAATVTAPLHLIAMSGAVAEAARGLPTRSVRVADRPDGEAMIAAIVTCLTDNAPN